MTTIRKIQLTELEILDEVVRICDLHGLTYFLLEGTLLGAIRHHGFIPWDDDIDIGMPRKDYNKFIDLCPTELSERFVIQYHENEPKYWLPFVKVRLKGTIYDEGSAPSGLIQRGFFIDIFPLDYSKRIDNIGQKVRNLFLLKVSHVVHTLSFDGLSIKKKTIQLVARIFRITPRKLLRIYAKEASKKKTGDYIVNRGSYYGYQKQTVPADWYFPVRKAEFEGKMYSVPNQAEKLLSKIYGDYMQLPPEGERVARHEALKIRFEDGTTE